MATDIKTLINVFNNVFGGVAEGVNEFRESSNIIKILEPYWEEEFNKAGLTTDQKKTAMVLLNDGWYGSIVELIECVRKL